MNESTVSLAQAVTASEAVLPVRVQEALGELVGAAKEGLLALSVGVGLGVLAELMEEEVDEVVGPQGKHDPDRTAVRHGHEAGEVTLGGRRVAVERPRVRSADGRAELPLATYAHFADRDPLTAAVLERMLAGSRRAATGVSRSPSVRRSRRRRARPRSRRPAASASRARASTWKRSRRRFRSGEGAPVDVLRAVQPRAPRRRRVDAPAKSCVSSPITGIGRLIGRRGKKEEGWL